MQVHEWCHPDRLRPGADRAAGPRRLLILLALLIASPAPASRPDAAQERAIVQTSPDGSLSVELRLVETPEEGLAPVYTIRRGQRVLVGPSKLGMIFREGGRLGDLRIRDVSTRSHDATWSVPVGKSSTARDHYGETTILLEEAAAPGRQIELVLRAYDDGAALRWRIPAQPAMSDFTIIDERVTFDVAGNPVAWVLPLNSYTTPYEDLYVPSRLDEITPTALAGLPLLLEYEDGLALAIAEADLVDWAGMYLAGAPEQPGRLVSSLSPLPGQGEARVKGKAPHVSPWRVVMVGEDVGDLVESNLLLNLSRPSRIADTSWIRPGKISFPWLNGYVGHDLGFEPGLNTATMKHYIDFCAANGIEYHSLDGREEEGAWYGGPLFPEGPVDITTARPGLDLPEVLRYAKEKSVGIRVWLHWKALMPQIDEAFAAYEKMGISGVMIDFMDRDDQETVGIYHEILEKAAKHRLTVNFHGSFKPTGIRRTWPNLLNYEAVFNLEHNKGFRFGCTPEQNVTVPFTRMLAGPLDYHQGILRTTTEAAYRPIWRGPEMIGTVCHQLAMFVVYENYLPMVGDYPQAYEAGGGIEFLGEVPVAWDETRYLAGRVGDYIIIARRSGSDWYVGAMTDGQARTLEVPLSFLGEGDFIAKTWRDDPDAAYQPAGVVREQQAVTADDTLALPLAPAGGFVMRIAPAPAGQ